MKEKFFFCPPSVHPQRKCTFGSFDFDVLERARDFVCVCEKMCPETKLIRNIFIFSSAYVASTKLSLKVRMVMMISESLWKGTKERTRKNCIQSVNILMLWKFAYTYTYLPSTELVTARLVLYTFFFITIMKIFSLCPCGVVLLLCIIWTLQ